MFATLLDDPGEINRQLGRYLAAGAAEVRAACADVLSGENRVVLTYVPAGGTAESLPEPGDDGSAEGGDGPVGPVADEMAEELA